MSKQESSGKALNTPRVGKLLAELLTTSDGDIAAFRARRCPNAGGISAEDLVHARDVLAVLGAALDSGDAGNWRRVEAAWRILAGDVSEAKARAELEREEAAAKARATPKRRQPATSDQVAPGAAPGVAPKVRLPPKPPSVFELEAPSDDGPPMPGRATSPWVRPSAAAREDRPAVASPLAPEPAFASPRATGERAPGANSRDVPSDVNETQTVLASALMLEPLPFKPVVDARPPASALPALPPLAEGDLDGTAVALRTFSVDETLPFVGGFSLRKELAATAAAAGHAPSEPAAPPGGVERPDSPDQREPSADEGASETNVAGSRELTVDQFAALCAACDVDPIHAAEWERQYGIVSREARRALDAAWMDRFRGDANVYRTFYARFHEYRGWFVGRRAKESVP